MNFKIPFILVSASAFLFYTSCSSSDSSSTQIDEDIPSDSTVVDSTDTPIDSLDLPEEGPITLPTGKGILLDDFEDGDGQSLLGGYWYTYDDKGNKGASTIETPLDTNGDFAPARVNNGSNYALKVVYTLDKGDYEWDPFVGWGVKIDESEENARLGGISYWYKGPAHEVHIEVSDVKDYDVHIASVKASPNAWREAVIRFKDLKQGGWGDTVEFNPAHINAVSFQAKGGSTVKTDSLYIDNIYLQDSSEVEKDKADMSINDPKIPEINIDKDSIAITNPLQEKAMKYLDKGVNFTNWLEENTKFNGTFKFNEGDVKIMAESGIKALRFPIDLDKYTTNRDEYVNDTTGKVELLFNDDTLFMVLDSFVAWTEAHKLSFTIDYHEYDNSYNVTSAANPRYVTMMAKVWQHVAKHYASNTREDIFFELLNEPDMTNGKVPSAVWHAAAQEIVDSIRAVDKVHSIIFGDAAWYSIDLLSKSEPLNDDNVIYAIHTYDPFVFTHQGASWGDTKDIKNLMFPYDKEKWSEYSADFGVTKSTPSWVKSAVKTYYSTGSKEYIMSVVLPAKKWASKNNVPVIINEFGAYRPRSDAKSVLNYMTALKELSEKLEIPLTHWGYTGGFALFDDSKNLFDGMAEAYGLK